MLVVVVREVSLLFVLDLDDPATRMMSDRLTTVVFRPAVVAALLGLKPLFEGRGAMFTASPKSFQICWLSSSRSL